MAYGIVKVDNITFDNGGSDQNVTVSGLYRATTSGVTVSGTIAATTVSGVTVIGSTTVSGATVTGTTANFTSGNFSNIISSAATMSGALIMASQQQVRFRELDNTNHIALQAPEIVSADQTITLPDQTGTVVTTGDNGSVTSTMILDGTILNANISASAAIADTKLATISTAGKVSGTAITSGTIATSGELRITNNTPAVSLTESDGTATHSQSLLVRSNNQFIIQTRNSAGVTLSNDYSIPANASGATDHIWRIANTEKARLNSAGLTIGGIGEFRTSSASAISLHNGTEYYGFIGNSSGNLTINAGGTSDTLTLLTNGVERVRVDSSGRLLVGTSTNSAVSTLVLQGNSTSSVGASFLFLQRGVSVPGTNDSLGVLTFGNNASNLGAQILSSRDGGTWTSGTSHPGRLLFFTTADGNSSPTERMRITSAGLVGIGTSSPATKLQVNDSTVYPALLKSTGVSSTLVLANSGTSNDFHQGIGAFGTDVSLVAGNARRVTVTSAGNVGIGTTSPAVPLDVVGQVRTTDSTVDLRLLPLAASGVGIVGTISNHALSLFTNNTERVRIDSSGRLLVGTSTADTTHYASVGKLFVEGTGDAPSSLVQTCWAASNTSQAWHVLAKSGGASVGTRGIVASGELLGTVAFEGDDGTNFIRAAQIRAEVDGTPGTNDMPGRLVFSTTADGNSSPTERMRIRSDGNIGIGGSGASNVSLYNQAALTGNVVSYANFTNATIQSDATTVGFAYSTVIGTQAAAFTTTIQHFSATQGVIGSGSTVSSQYGFVASPSLTGATNNYGFFGNIASGTGRYNFFAQGTAPNYFAGDLRTNTVVTRRTSTGNSDVSATATASSLLDGLRTGIPTGNITLTLPTGTDMDAAFQDLQANQSFEWSVINRAAATHLITVTAAATGHTVVGNMAVAAATSGRFLTRKTAANTFVSYRIG
jgi:hypothetical protein